MYYVVRIGIPYDHMTTSHAFLEKAYQMVGIHTEHSPYLNISLQLYKHKFISLEVNMCYKTVAGKANQNVWDMHEAWPQHSTICFSLSVTLEVRNLPISKSNQIKSNQILFKVGNVHLKEKKK